MAAPHSRTIGSRWPRGPDRATTEAHLRGWAGTLYLWPARGLYVGWAGETAAHAHHAVQICVALQGDFGIRSAPREQWRSARVALIGSDTVHALNAGDSPLALLYLDPEERGLHGFVEAGVRICDAAIATAELTEMAAHLERIWRAQECMDEAASVCGRLLSLLSPAHAALPTSLDARVARALERLRSLPGRTPVATVAGSVRLSPSRFAHLFRAQTGLPFRRYLLWLRLVRALHEMADGGSLTAAAHGAGFADSAHLTRTFRRMLGIAPSALHRGSRLVRGGGLA